MSDIVKHEPGRVVVPQIDMGSCAGSDDTAGIFLYLRILSKRKWIVLASLVVVMAAAAGRIYLSTPLYRATARIQIEPEARILPYQDNSAVVNADYIATQCEILRSDTLARRVAVRMGLASTAEASATQAGWIRGNISVLPMPGTMVVKLSFDAADPEMAAEVVNALTAEYIDHHFESKYQSSAKTREVLRGELEELKVKVEKSERELVDYALQNNQVLLADRNDNVIQRRLADLNQQLNQVERDLLANRYQDVEGGPDASLPASLITVTLKELEQRQAQLEDDLAALSEQFGPKWPDVKKAKRELSLVRERIKQERRHIVEQAQLQYELLKGHRARLMKAIRGQNALVHRLNKDSISFSILKREAETDQQLYDALLQSYKEATISAGLKSVNVRVIDRANVPGKPYSPNIPINLALGFGLGLVSGVTFAFALESIDRTVTTPLQVHRELGLPTLGIIPFLPNNRGGSGATGGVRTVSAKNGGRDWSSAYSPLGIAAPRLPQEDGHQSVTMQPGYFAESYRSLRTRLVLAPELRSVQTLLVTSALPGEGKSTTCANLASALAALGAPTLILEFDLRNPKMKEHFHTTSRHDLTDYLDGKCPLASTINPTPAPNLFVAFAGVCRRDPAELMASERVEQALRQSAREYRYVLLDTPPILPVSDTMVLAGQADGLVLVIRAGRTTREAVQEARERVTNVGGSILGAVINAADCRAAEYRYGKGYHAETYGPGVYS